jgi:hypothetical protein
VIRTLPDEPEQPAPLVVKLRTLTLHRWRIKMDLLKKEMAIERDKAIRSFLKSSKTSGMKFTTLPDELSDLVNFIGISSREFDKLFKRVSVETITLANAEMRRKLGNYLDEMEAMLGVLADLSVMSDNVRDDKIVLATVESNATTPLTNDDSLGHN